MKAILYSLLISLLLTPTMGMAVESSALSTEEYVGYVATGIEKEVENMRSAVPVDRNIAQSGSLDALDQQPIYLEEISELEPE